METMSRDNQSMKRFPWGKTVPKRSKRPKVEKPIPRSSLTWLLVAYIAVVIPHFILYLPLWILPIALVAFYWRYEIYRMRRTYPSGLVKTLLVVALLAVMGGVYGNFFNTIGSSVLLVALFSLKFVEARTLRDGWVLVLLAYFTLAVGFIFDTSMWMALFSLIPLWATTMALLGFEQSDDAPFKNGFMFKEVTIALFAALPLMIALFFVFPRFPSLLSLNQDKTEIASKMGVGDRLNPGDISELAENDELMFWAEFDGMMPRREDLYWRVLTLDHFDGKGWSRSPQFEHSSMPARVIPRGLQYAYFILYEPTHRKDVVALDISMNPQGERYRQHFDYRFEAPYPVTSKIRYELVASPMASLDRDLPPNHPRLERYREVEAWSNPETAAWVLGEKLRVSSPEALVNRILTHIHNEEYVYTLKPGRLTGNVIDQFFIDSKRGFCEHYASSLAFMLRVADIPARIVMGYHGGLIDAEKRRVQVRGSHAHAWVEYWLEGRGWVRVDPTGAIHPSRIEDGIEGLQGDLGDRNRVDLGLFGQLSYSFTAFKEQLEYFWAKTILGYKPSQLMEGLSDLFGVLSLRKLLLLLAGFFGVLFGGITLMILKPWQMLRFDEGRSYQKLIDRLNHRAEKRGGVEILRSDSHKEILAKLEGVLDVPERAVLEELFQEFERLHYAPEVNGKSAKARKNARKKLYQSLFRAL